MRSNKRGGRGGVKMEERVRGDGKTKKVMLFTLLSSTHVRLHVLRAYVLITHRGVNFELNADFFFYHKNRFCASVGGGKTTYITSRSVPSNSQCVSTSDETGKE